MRNQLAQRLRSASLPVLSAVPPSPTSTEYSLRLSNLATRILYRSPLPSRNDLPVFVLNAAALPDAKEVDYDALLPYVLVRLPDEEELIGGHGYEVVFFAGGKSNGATTPKKGRPGWGWFLQAYHLLTRATRKRLQKLYIVHEKNWIRLLVGMFSTIVSPKFNKKVVHGKTAPAVVVTPRKRCSACSESSTVCSLVFAGLRTYLLELILGCRSLNLEPTSSPNPN